MNLCNIFIAAIHCIHVDVHIDNLFSNKIALVE